jgi:hypothetical protein
MVWYIVIGLLVLITLPEFIKRIKEKREYNRYINELTQAELLKGERLHTQTQKNVDFLTAKIDNLIYISELTEKQLQAEKDDKKILILTKQLQTIDDKIFNAQIKLDKELEKLEV